MALDVFGSVAVDSPVEESGDEFASSSMSERSIDSRSGTSFALILLLPLLVVSMLFEDVSTLL